MWVEKTIAGRDSSGADANTANQNNTKARAREANATTDNASGTATKTQPKIPGTGQDPQRRRALGVAGRAKCMAQFDWQKKIDQILEIYRTTIDGHIQVE